MGSAEAEGDERATQCVRAHYTPLLNDNNIKLHMCCEYNYVIEVVLMDGC